MEQAEKVSEENAELKANIARLGNISKEELAALKADLANARSKVAGMEQEINELQDSKSVLAQELQGLKVANRVQEVAFADELEAKTSRLKKKSEMLQKELTTAKVIEAVS